MGPLIFSLNSFTCSMVVTDGECCAKAVTYMLAGVDLEDFKAVLVL